MKNQVLVYLTRNRQENNCQLEWSRSLVLIAELRCCALSNCWAQSTSRREFTVTTTTCDQQSHMTVFNDTFSCNGVLHTGKRMQISVCHWLARIMYLNTLFGVNSYCYTKRFYIYGTGVKYLHPFSFLHDSNIPSLLHPYNSSLKEMCLYQVFGKSLT